MAFTFFFRDKYTLEQAVKYFLPTIDGLRKVKIWDAGCAMGPEPFTFAILLAEKMGYFAFKNVVIDASDLDETELFGGLINEGVYSGQDLKRIPEEIFSKYFEPARENGYFIISENIRKRIIFCKHDLLTLKPFGRDYNMVICKNVLLHFQPEERKQVLRMFHSTLVPGGLLVLEKTQALPEEISHLFELIAPDAHIFKKV